jgi:hypothetical protein
MREALAGGANASVGTLTVGGKAHMHGGRERACLGREDAHAWEGACTLGRGVHAWEGRARLGGACTPRRRGVHAWEGEACTPGGEAHA